MRKIGIASLLAMALAVALSGAPAPNKAKTHGIALSGTVLSVDEGRAYNQCGRSKEPMSHEQTSRLELSVWVGK